MPTPRLYEREGVFLTLGEWCDVYDICGSDYEAIRCRLKRKWSVREAFEAPFDRRDLAQRFWDAVPDRPEDPDLCWEWVGWINYSGYGCINHKYKHLLAHRVGWEVQGGELIDGLVLDHLCRNTKCVRKSHLDQVTSKENSLRGVSAWAVNARKTHCCRGHEFTEENTRILVNPKTNAVSRNCKECVRGYSKNRKKKEGDKPNE